MTDCKHAAAVLLVAQHLVAAAQLVERPEWEKRLERAGRGYADSGGRHRPARAASSGSSGFRPSAATSAARTCGSGRPDWARPAHWVRSGIGWDDLDFVTRSYVSEHRELLLQFRAAAGASARYALPRSAWLSLRTVSSGFWGLLDQAAALGLTVITAKPLVGPIRSDKAATVGLDLRAARGRRAGGQTAGRARRR